MKKLKALTKIFTRKDWRRMKRQRFFEEIFEDLKDDRSDGKYDSFTFIKGKHDSFTFIKTSGSTFADSCWVLACKKDYNPILDKGCELNIGQAFGRYMLDNNRVQTYDYLYAKIKKISSTWKILTNKSGFFEIHINGKENGEEFEFSYIKNIKIWTQQKKLATSFSPLDFFLLQEIIYLNLSQFWNFSNNYRIISSFTISIFIIPNITKRSIYKKTCSQFISIRKFHKFRCSPIILTILRYRNI